MPLITCEEHGKSPGGVICRHIYNGTAQVAVHVPGPSGDEGEDYLCPDCATHPWDLGRHDILTACMHCAREIVSQMTVIRLQQLKEAK